MFLSRGLTDAETRYSTTEIELLALIFTIKKAQFFLTKPFKVFTDHIPLKLILSIKTSVSSRITRWAAFLSSWTFTVEYLPGARNKVADYLSRMPNLNQKARPHLIDLEKEIAELKKIIQRGKPVELYSNQAPVLAITADAPFEPIVDRTQILEEQRKDKDIQEIIQNLAEDQENDLGYFLDTDGLLYRSRGRREERDKLVVPKIFSYWPGMYKDIEQYCRASQICNQFKPDIHKKKAPLKHMFQPKHPGHMAAIDICGPFRTTPNFNKYVLSYQDMYSRYLTFVPIEDCMAETVAKAYCKHILPHHRSTEKLICDNGAGFVAET